VVGRRRTNLVLPHHRQPILWGRGSVLVPRPLLPPPHPAQRGCNELGARADALVAKWRRLEAEASAWFWDRGFKLHDLKMADADRHDRLLAAIHALDLACAHERPHEIAAAGKAVVAEWKAVIAFMRQGFVSEAAQ